MVYLNTNTNEYPRHVGDLALVGWVAGDNLPDGWFKVELSEPPIVEDGFVAYEVTPLLIDGVYVQQWATREFTDAERLANRKSVAAWKVAKGIGLDDDEAQLLIF